LVVIDYSGYHKKVGKAKKNRLGRKVKNCLIVENKKVKNSLLK